MTSRRSYPGKYTIALRRGTLWRRVWTWKIDGVPVDLTGATANMHFREDINSVDPTLEYSSPSGGIVLGGVEGTIEITIGTADIALLDLQPARYVYDLKVDTGEPLTLLEGIVTVDQEVTRL